MQTSGPASQKQKHPEVAPPPEIGSDGIEVYGQQQSLQQKKALPKVTTAPGTPPPEKKEKPLEQDDPSMPVPPEAKCKRLGCEATYDGGNREDEDEKCVFHPGAPIFHEGAKDFFIFPLLFVLYGEEEEKGVEGEWMDEHMGLIGHHRI